MPSPRALAPLLAALVLAVAGCGGGGPSKEDYISDAEAIGKDIEKAGGGLQGSKADTPQELAGELETLQTRLDDSVKKFEDLEPPDDVEDAHAKALDAFRGFSKEIDPVVDAAKSGDIAKLQSTLSGGFPSPATQKLVKDAQKLYKDAGYDQLAS